MGDDYNVDFSSNFRFSTHVDHIGSATKIVARSSEFHCEPICFYRFDGASVDVSDDGEGVKGMVLIDTAHVIPFVPRDRRE